MAFQTEALWLPSCTSDICSKTVHTGATRRGAARATLQPRTGNMPDTHQVELCTLLQREEVPQRQRCNPAQHLKIPFSQAARLSDPMKLERLCCWPRCCVPKDAPFWGEQADASPVKAHCCTEC